MTPVISHKQGATGLLRHLDWPGLSLNHAIVESPSAVDFLQLGDTVQIERAMTYPSGIAFGPEAELRWLERASGSCHLVLISDAGVKLPGAEPVRLRKAPPAQVLAWGLKDAAGGFFYEPRIPRLLEYPGAPDLQPGRRLKIDMKSYILTETVPDLHENGVRTRAQKIRIFRCSGLADGGFV